jgi:hypothetical protein
LFSVVAVNFSSLLFAGKWLSLSSSSQPGPDTRHFWPKGHRGRLPTLGCATVGKGMHSASFGSAGRLSRVSSLHHPSLKMTFKGESFKPPHLTLSSSSLLQRPHCLQSAGSRLFSPGCLRVALLVRPTGGRLYCAQELPAMSGLLELCRRGLLKRRSSQASQQLSPSHFSLLLCSSVTNIPLLRSCRLKHLKTALPYQLALGRRRSLQLGMPAAAPHWSGSCSFAFAVRQLFSAFCHANSSWGGAILVVPGFAFFLSHAKRLVVPGFASGGHFRFAFLPC